MRPIELSKRDFGCWATQRRLATKLCTIVVMVSLACCYTASAQSNIDPQVNEVLNAFGEARVLVVMNPPEAGEPESFAFSQPEQFVESLLGPVEVEGPRARQIASLPVAVANMNRNQVELLRGSQLVKAVIYDEPQMAFLDGSITELGVDKIHNSPSPGSDLSVVVMDTGVDYSHGFLQGRLRAEACFSTTDSGAFWKTETLCGNGYDQDMTPGSGLHCTGFDACGHGTHVAGIAVGSNGDVESGTISGMAPNAGLIAIKVFSKFDSTEICGAQGTCIRAFVSDQLEALEHINWLAKHEGHKIAAVNISLGGVQGHYGNCDDSNALTGHIEMFREMGIATVIASGNSGHYNAVSSPGCVSSAITVGATKREGIEPDVSYSNMSQVVDFVAPGTHILSASGNGYSRKTGTSMATPHIAGLFALLRSHNPDATVEHIEASIRRTARQTKDPRTGWAYHFPDGHAALLDLQKASDLISPQGTNGGSRFARTINMEEFAYVDRIIVIPNKRIWAAAGTQEIMRRITQGLGPETRVSVLGNVGFVAQNNGGFEPLLLEQLLVDLGANARIFEDEVLGISGMGMQ